MMLSTNTVQRYIALYSHNIQVTVAGLDLV